MFSSKNPSSGIRSLKNVLVWAFVLVTLAAIAAGQIEQGPIIAQAEQISQPAVLDITSAEADVSAEDKAIQSINFKKDVTIRDALRFLAAKYQKNIVPSPKVDGQLAFTSLYDVSFEEAMNAILGGRFEYEQKGSLIEVYPTGDESRMKYAVFALDYITAAEAQKLIAPVLSSKGTVGSTTPAQTGVPVGESISAQTGGGDTMSLKDTIVVYDYAENIKRAQEVISAIDVRPIQVLIETTILSATLTEDTQFGIDLSSIGGASITVASSEGITTSGLTSKVTGTSGLTAAFSIDDVTGFIRALESVTDTTILANPKILAVNKQLGQVYIGDKIGYNSQTTLVEGVGSTSEVSFLDTGTKLSFRPYIGTDGYIRMDIHAKNSKETTGDVISETSTELVSNIMVKNGGTVVIGGLFQDTIEVKKSQVPLLGDLPIVGAAFRGTADQSVRKEVIVLLTPHIIEEPSETEGQARVEDIRRKRFGAKEELQWIGRARLAEDRYAKAVKYYVEGDGTAALQEVNAALEIHPTYLEALRLKERIVNTTGLHDQTETERVILEDFEQEGSQMWNRR